MAQRKILSIILLITLLIAYLDRVNVSVLVADSTFLNEMGIAGDATRMGMLMSLFLLTYGVANVILAPIGDILGPKKAMMIAVALWMVSIAIGGLAPTFTVLLISRFLLGVGEAMHWPMQGKYVKNWFPPFERGQANGTWCVALFLGPAVAMPFFVQVISSLGWRGSFATLVGFGFIPLLLLAYFTTDTPETHPRITKEELAYIEAGMAAEKEQEAALANASTMDNIKMFITNYKYWLLIGYYIGNACIFWGMVAWLPSYLKVARGFSWSSMGMLSSLPYILGTIMCYFGGRYGDKMKNRAWIMVVALTMPTLGIFIGANVTDNLMAALVIAIGFGFLSIGIPNSWTLMQNIVPSKAVGTGMGVMNGISNFLSGFVPVIIGMAIDMAGSYTAGLMVVCLLGLISACLSTVLALSSRVKS